MVQSGREKHQVFHACATQSQRKNRIHLVLNEDNQVVDVEVESKEVFNKYFQKLFTSSNPSSMEIDECLNNVEKKVTNGMNLELNKPFTCPEVEEALNQLAPLKSPGPDGFNAGLLDLLARYRG